MSHRERNLVFEYDLNTLFHKHDLQFSTRMVEFEAQPSPWSSSTSRELVGLPDGSFRFEVRAKDHFGREIGPVTLRFRRLPAPSETWWARLSYLLIALSGAYGALRFRLRILHRRIESLEALVAEQSRSLDGKN